MLNVLDVFSGIGAFSLGLEWTKGFKTVAFCENDKDCHKVLKKHWLNVPIYNDIKKLTYEKLKEDRISKIDVIAGGFPCQDISNVGKKAGLNASRSGLWSEMRRLISEIRPKYAIVENVPALLCRGFEHVLADLAEIGYDAEWHCIPASAIGANHQRDRAWIIAYPSSKRLYKDGIQDRIIDKASQESVEERTYIRSNVSRVGKDKLRGTTKSEFCRENDGVATGLDKCRIKQLGNTVLPQTPYLIGLSILELEKLKAGR